MNWIGNELLKLRACQKNIRIMKRESLFCKGGYHEVFVL